jgi:hypothetical protein
MRFEARHLGSGVWGIWDGGVMSWRATDLGENDARQQVADLNVIYNQYGQREERQRREVKPPIEVESAKWLASWTTGSESRRSGGVAYGVQTGITCGSRPLIFDGQRADRRDRSSAVDDGELTPLSETR